ncbi:hypothetical protein DICPUDRAFT_76062 [Dictyostelium purpureum]|uniref:SUMO-activating enzyme subunit n=1 Tax=Dictyostelium purpureum TaxID=5786 RepID=F0ZCH3_DICPU|nr:uncharacterized protein DICPUDRAFT_76062 [Dictyostelium purpureum]EGC38344.1 hypothetical protein DICPUDRAFT_76062 [Dictyostelium purpureum]|eukprot:XP_003285101.1 hypothetical protein DICPUDRAFT_76062 [Dictyostelium purpureum]
MTDRFSAMKLTYGEECFKAIQESKVLVIGAGGIGCEVLKNLVLAGFINIDVVDLDIIDISNLNRQFLFRMNHVGQPKALVAKDAVLQYNPLANINAYHGDVKTQQFDLEYFKKFNLVLSALDNISARRHVNRLCLSAGLPLVESGTAGYLGQVTIIKKGETECYECHPLPVPKQFPVCTIRSNPSAPIHCIVWAKMLFGKLFGGQKNGGDDDTNGITDMDNNIISGSEENGDIVRDEQLLVEKEKGYKRWVFHKVFNTDIQILAKMADLWKEKQPPSPLSLDNILDQKEIDETSKEGDQLINQLKDQKLWSFKENVEVFLDCAEKLKDQSEKENGLVWDKDDEISLSFVCSASNIRSQIFNIPMKSRFDVKSMAGNIIPAIGTTNAIISGLVLTEAIKIIGGRFNECHSTYLMKEPSSRRLLIPTSLEEPNPKCFVCNRNFITCKLNTDKVTVGKFVNEILKKSLAVNEPILTVGNDLIYEGGDQDLDKEEIAQRKKIEEKIMGQYRLVNGSQVIIEDYNQDFKVTMNIVHTNEFDEDIKKKKEEENKDQNRAKQQDEKKKEEDEKWFEIIGSTTTPSNENKKECDATNTNENGMVDDDDDFEILETPVPESLVCKTSSTASTNTTTTTNTTSLKRKYDEEDSEISDAKKQKSDS